MEKLQVQRYSPLPFAPPDSTTMEGILVFEGDFDVALFDNVVKAFYRGTNATERKQAEQVLNQFKAHNDAWLKADQILEKSTESESKCEYETHGEGEEKKRRWRADGSIVVMLHRPGHELAPFATAAVVVAAQKVMSLPAPSLPMQSLPVQSLPRPSHCPLCFTSRSK